MKGKDKSILFLALFSSLLMSITVFLNILNYQNKSTPIVTVVKQSVDGGNKVSLASADTNQTNLTASSVVSDSTNSDNKTLKNSDKKAIFPTYNLFTSVAVNTEVLVTPVAVLNDDPLVYDGLTLSELADKLNRSLNSTVSGYGELFASYSLQVGVDPYMAVAIMLHETGCSYNCSSLVNSCNNVGGQKGSPSCGSGSYKAYPTLEDGIKGYLDNLANNYIAHGLTTPETIGPKYAASPTWSSKIYYFMDKIKAA